MRILSLASIFALVATSHAFSTVPAFRLSTTRLSLMTQDESEALITKVNHCAEGECGIDDVSELIYTLQEQQKELSDRLDQVRKMIHALEHVNESDERKVDEVRETVRAIFRIFQLGDKASGNNYPALSKPVGWSGEVGKGPTTAYDALPPKRISKKQP